MNEEKNQAAGPLGELLRIAGAKTTGPHWSGPVGGVDRLLDVVRGLEGSSIGHDWTDALPSELWELWGDLSDEAKLAAFIVAADFAPKLGRAER